MTRSTPLAAVGVAAFVLFSALCSANASAMIITVGQAGIPGAVELQLVDYDSIFAIGFDGGAGFE